MQFQDDLAAGVVLVRPALQSPDYVAGTSGWAIFQDGSAEFNDGTFRGTTTISGTGLYYDGSPAAGNLSMSLAAADGTDAYGNAYVEGLGIYDVDGSQLQLVSGAGASMVLTPADLVGTTWHTAVINTTTGASNRPGLSLTSPSTTVNNSSASITMFGGGPTTSDTSMFLGADRVSFTGNAEFPTGSITTYSSWTSFTPTWNNVGTATFSRNLGWWKRIGDMYYFEIYTVANAAGSGTTNVTISGLPFDPYRAGGGAGTTRQTVTAYIAAVSAGTNSSVSGSFTATALAGGAASTLDRLSGPTDIPMRGENISSTMTATIQGWMRAV